MNEWDKIKAQGAMLPFTELEQPYDDGKLGEFYDQIVVLVGAVELPPEIREPGEPRGLPVLRFVFQSSNKENGPPDVTISLLTMTDNLHDLRMIIGDAIDSAAKLGRKIR